MKAIAFYLPQFHPIPENDQWWGAGFTEWTNVVKARPMYSGHYQPHTPAELGFYDLRLRETRAAQAALASRFGVGGFCYYHYWFNGKLLLEKPLEAMLADGEPSIPFCYCWANETWTRRWDGREHEILIAQDYATYDPEAHFAYLNTAFNDARYMRIAGKPLFLVYRIDQFPDIGSTIARWRAAAKDAGLPGIYLCAVKSHMHRLSDTETIEVGFDSLVGFEPHSRTMARPRLWSFIRYLVPRALNYLRRSVRLQRWLREMPVLDVYDYRAVAGRAMRSEPSPVRCFPAVIPTWDNSPRRTTGATVIQNDDPALFAAWLRDAARRVAEYPEEERLVFINAWNEWAEGCHLEPDMRNGTRFLEAIASVFGSVESG
jgi:lipopolysaccharide biosynthesis protein